LNGKTLKNLRLKAELSDEVKRYSMAVAFWRSYCAYVGLFYDLAMTADTLLK
jgi:hypothetical protein